MTASQVALPLSAIASSTRQAARKLAVLPTEAKNQAIEAIAKALETATPEILAANAADCQAAEVEGIAKPLYNRLKLDATKLNAAIDGVRDVGKLNDPIGSI
ncbi:MAG: gamma-glutamyl-phosphate reductase, partial [Coleofasciculaceae cyanobacterium]